MYHGTSCSTKGTVALATGIVLPRAVMGILESERAVGQVKGRRQSAACMSTILL